MLAASTVAASAQAPAKPATTSKPAAHAAASKPATPVVKPSVAASPAVAAFIKAPAGLPPVAGVQKPIFTVALRYQEIKAGTGAAAEPNKLYKVLYTGWRAKDGVKFDSSDDHRMPLRDKDGKVVMGDDGKPKLGDPAPMPFPEGMGQVITGFEQGFAGMKVGGKRRIFIPWQLAYGTRDMPDRSADHPGIPSRSDLIFDVELVDVSEIPPMPTRPGMGGMHPMPGGHPMPSGHPAPGTPATPPAPGTATSPATAPTSAAPPPPATTATPSATPAPATAPKPAAPAAAPTAPAAPAQSQPK